MPMHALSCTKPTLLVGGVVSHSRVICMSPLAMSDDDDFVSLIGFRPQIPITSISPEKLANPSDNKILSPKVNQVHSDNNRDFCVAKNPIGSNNGSSNQYLPENFDEFFKKESIKEMLYNENACYVLKNLPMITN